MTTQTEPEITLYDLACTKGECFSPAVWRIRLMLNYKNVSYNTVFLEFPDIEPELKKLRVTQTPKIVTVLLHRSANVKYTVPAIFHRPSTTYMMDSAPISQFIETTYPSPSVQLSSPLGDKVLHTARTAGVRAYRLSMLPRETYILHPRSAAYFRSAREAELGHPLERLLEGDAEEKAWAEQAESMVALGKLMRTNKDAGPFLLGERLSYADFFVMGVLQCAKVVDEGVWDRLMRFEGWRDVYVACERLTEKKD